MKIDCISDLHGEILELPNDGDVLIIAGDCTATDTLSQWQEFLEWLGNHHYKNILIVPGNHDRRIQLDPREMHSFLPKNVRFLIDEECTIDGFRFYGCPWTHTFKWQNPLAMAFAENADDLTQYYDKIPSDLDVLITHGPPKGILDTSRTSQRCGNDYLMYRVEQTKPKHHIFGHIHEWGGCTKENEHTKFYNVAHCDQWYDGKNPARTIILDK